MNALRPCAELPTQGRLGKAIAEFSRRLTAKGYTDNESRAPRMTVQTEICAPDGRLPRSSDYARYTGIGLINVCADNNMHWLKLIGPKQQDWLPALAEAAEAAGLQRVSVDPPYTEAETPCYLFVLPPAP